MSILTFRNFAKQLKIQRHLILPGLVICWVVFATVHFLVSCSISRTEIAPPPIIDGAHFIGNQACTTCHEDITKKFPSSVHARMHPTAGASGLDVSCESCHGPGSRHRDSGGGTSFKRLIVNPGRSSEACFKCHLDVESQFHLPSHHPVLEGKMNCVDCHDPHGHDIMKPAGGLAFAMLDESCANCHREQTHKFVFEHEAMREGCTTCHRPHGSITDKLLIQRDANLCLKCHAQVPGANGEVTIGKMNHALFLQQGNCSTTGCHTAVHGSNIHPKLLH